MAAGARVPRGPGLGAILASLFLQAAYGEISTGPPSPARHLGRTAVLTEGVLTLGLVSVILGTASGARNVGFNGAIAVGGYIGLVSYGVRRSRARR